jgi:hypothetical protein
MEEIGTSRTKCSLWAKQRICWCQNRAKRMKTICMLEVNSSFPFFLVSLQKEIYSSNKETSNFSEVGWISIWPNRIVIRWLELCSKCWGHHPRVHDHLCLHLSLHITALFLWTRTFHPNIHTQETSNSMHQNFVLKRRIIWWWQTQLSDGVASIVVLHCLLKGVKPWLRKHFSPWK